MVFVAPHVLSTVTVYVAASVILSRQKRGHRDNLVLLFPDIMPCRSVSVKVKGYSSAAEYSDGRIYRDSRHEF